MNQENTIPTTDPLPFSDAMLRQLRIDLAELERESRVLKARLRRRWCEPMGAAQQRLAELALASTYRLIALAASRGRFHVLRMPRSGSVPGTDQYYVRTPGTSLYTLVRWDPVAHRERVVRALLPIYDTAFTLAAPQVSP